jgi:hypothetical protein
MPRIDKWSDAQKSHFQLAKMQETTIRKDIRHKYTTDVSLNFEFPIGQVYVIRG